MSAGSEERNAPALEAVKGGAGEPGLVAYAEVGASIPAGGCDKRAGKRRRTRLRSGKIADLRNQFICDCVLHDRSNGGLRVRLAEDVALPNRIRIFDDEAGELMSADIAWRRGRDLGIRAHVAEPPGAAAIDAPSAAALGRPYYALANRAPGTPRLRR